MIRTERATCEARKARGAASLATAEACLQARNAFEAARIARRFLRSDRDHLGAIELLARALWQLQRYEDLVATSRRMIRLDPYNPGYRSLYGAALQCLGRFGEAVRAFAEAGRLDPNEGSKSESLIADLRAWQSNLIAAQLADGGSFEVRYERDPRAACEADGFEFLETSDGIRAWVHARPQPAVIQLRPS